MPAVRPGPATRAWLPVLATLAASCVAGEVGSNRSDRFGPGGAEPGDPGAGPAAPESAGLPTRRLRRLSSREYNNVVRDLLGDSTRPASRFLADSYANGFDNGSAGLAVQTEQAVAYQNAAEALAERAVERDLGSLLGGCQPASDGEAACRAAFLDSFPQRAFRRPLTASEAERVARVFDVGAAADGFPRGVALAIELLLQSPQFLYREELGERSAGPGRVRLTGHELASQLSFLLTGSMPDAQLFTAAGEGRLATPEDMQREAARLIATAAARDNVRQLLDQWLAVDRIEGLSKDEQIYPQFTAELATSMKRDFDALLDKAVWGASGSLQDLLISTDGRVDEPLARLYGLPAPAGVEDVSLDPALRRGLLTRPAFLAVHGAADGGGPIGRGVFVLSNLLCVDIPEPPPDVVQDPPPGAERLDLTSRPGVEEHSSDPRCQPCHVSIDGIGFGFEQFDGIGAHRTRYPDGKPVDTRGALVGTDVDGPFEGVSELALRLAFSGQVRDCFARHLYRFAMGQVEPHGPFPTARYGLQMTSRLTDALVELVAGPEFFERAID